MSVLAEFTVPAADFVLADTLTAAPDMHVEIKRVAAGKTHVTPYFWASGGDFPAFDEAVADRRGIEPSELEPLYDPSTPTSSIRCSRRTTGPGSERGPNWRLRSPSTG